MGYNGFLSLGGVELINATRTEEYIEHELPTFPMRTRVGTDALRLALGDEPYENPAVDDAPWVDHSDPATYGFYGLIPLAIEGLDSSTRGAALVEGILDGGTVGHVRRSMKPVRVSAVLVARDQAGLEAGQTWLDAALNPSSCDNHSGTCGAADLCYFRQAPEFDPTAVDRNFPIDSETSFINVSPTTSPVAEAFPLRNGPARARWVPIADDGAVVVYGMMDRETSEIMYQTEPIRLQRTNLFPNPSFTVNSNGVRVFRSHTELDPTPLDTNYIYDGRGRTDNPLWGARRDRWFGGGGASGTHARLTGRTDGPTPELDSYLRKEWVTGLTSPGTSAMGDSGFNLAAAGQRKAVTPGQPLYLKAWVRSSRAGRQFWWRVPTYDAANASIATVSAPRVVLPAGQWTLMEFTYVPAPGVAQISLILDSAGATTAGWEAGDTLDITGIIMSDTDLPFFDGLTPSDPGPGYVYQFSGTQFASVSRKRTYVLVPADPDEDIPEPAEHITTGGANGGAYARGKGPGNPTVWFNYAPNPSAEFDIAGTGWSTNAPLGIQRVPFPAPQTTGTNAAEVRRDDLNPSNLWIELESRGPEEPVDGNVSFWLMDPRGEVPGVASTSGRITVFDRAGAVVTQGNFTMPGTYNRQSLETPIARGYRVRIETDSNASDSGIRIDGVMFSDRPGTPPVYFDGDSVDTPTQVSSWLGAPQTSGSTAVMGLTDEVTLLLDLPTLPRDGSMLSMMVKSAGPANVTIVTFDTETNELLSSSIFPVTSVWSAATIAVRGNQNTGVYLTTRGPSNEISIDCVLLEAGDDQLDYFDPDQPPAGYRGEWLGTTHQSPSRVTWNGDLETNRLSSDWRPFFQTIEGNVPYLALELHQFGGLAIEDCMEPLERQLRHTTCIEGPTPIRELAVESGAARVVEFTLVAGRPYQFSTPRTVVDVKLNEIDSSEFGGDDCPPPTPSVVVDPTAPPLPAPPRPPVVPSQYVAPLPNIWHRHFIEIPAIEVSNWAASIPIVKVRTKSTEERNLRVRFHPNPFDYPLIPGSFTRVNLALAPDASPSLFNWWADAKQASLVYINYMGRGMASATSKGTFAAGSFGLRHDGIGSMVVTPGLRYSGSMLVGVHMDMKKRRPRIIDRRFIRVEMEYVNAQGVVVGGDTSQWHEFRINQLGRLGVTNSTAPAGAVRARMVVRARDTLQAGDGLAATDVLFEQSVRAGSYFNGNTPDTDSGIFYAWTGGENRSTSTGVYTPIDPCNWCAEFMISYMPPNSELIMDGPVQSALIAVGPNAPIVANNLLYGTGGVPVTWPELECGQSYFMTVDTDGPSDTEIVIELTRRE